jgi:alkylated DNA repair dioxygenase AlkB
MEQLLPNLKTEMISDKLITYGKENFGKLMALCPPENSKVLVYNKNKNNPEWIEEKCARCFKSYLATPKFTTNVNKSYMFSGFEKEEIESELPEEFKPFYEYMRKKNDKYNQVIVNWYKYENDYIPMHADWTNGMVDDYEISILTLNENDDTEREFKILNKEGDEDDKILKLKTGQLLTMHGDFQEKYRHGVMKLSENKIANARISIAFRQFIDDKS